MKKFYIQYNNKSGDFGSCGTTYNSIIKLKTLNGVINRINNSIKPEGSTQAKIFIEHYGKDLHLKTINL